MENVAPWSLDLHFTGGPVKSPQELSLAEPVMASDESTRSDHPVAHLLESIQDVVTGGGELHLSDLLVLKIWQRGCFFWQDSKLVYGQPIHRAAECKQGKIVT